MGKLTSQNQPNRVAATSSTYSVLSKQRLTVTIRLGGLVKHKAMWSWQKKQVPLAANLTHDYSLLEAQQLGRFLEVNCA